MDYASAKDRLSRHAENVRKATGIVSKHNPDWMLLGNRTKLEYLSYNVHGIDGWVESPTTVPTYRVTLFGNPIIMFREKHLTITTSGVFRYTTLRRLNEYMPRGFRIWRETNTVAGHKRLLGYVQTPKGTFPSCMPMTFDYDGTLLGTGLGNQLPSDTKSAVAAIPKYIDEYLTKAFAGSVPTSTDLTLHGGYRAWAYCIENSLYPAFMLSTAVAGAMCTISTAKDAVVSAHRVALLLEEGHGLVFTGCRRAPVVAERMEQCVKLDTALGGTRRELKTQLRRMLASYLLDQLGFDDIEWNRR